MRRTYLWPFTILSSAVLISLVLVGDDRSPGRSSNITALSGDPCDSFVLKLELGGQVVAEYTECFGLGSSNEIQEAVVQTNSGDVKQKTPGALEWHNITLKRIGPSGGQVWSLWRKAMEEGRTNEAIQDGAIILSKAGSSEALARWNFIKGWPASLTIEGSVEELVIVHRGLERVAPSDERRREPGQR